MESPSASTETTPFANTGDAGARTRLWEQRHLIVSRVEISIRYHRWRESFFEGTERVIKTGTIILSSAALAGLFGNETAVFAGLLALSAVLQAVSIGFGLESKSKIHAALAEKFSGILERMLRRGEQRFSSQDLAEWEAEIARIEANEPARLPVVAAISQNDYERSTVQQERFSPIPVGGVRRIIGHVIPVAPHGEKAAKEGK